MLSPPSTPDNKMQDLPIIYLSTPDFEMQTEETAAALSTLPTVLSPLPSSQTEALKTIIKLVDSTINGEGNGQIGGREVGVSVKSVSPEKSKNSRPNTVLSRGGSRSSSGMFRKSSWGDYRSSNNHSGWASRSYGRRSGYSPTKKWSSRSPFTKHSSRSPVKKHSPDRPLRSPPPDRLLRSPPPDHLVLKRRVISLLLLRNKQVLLGKIFFNKLRR